MDKEKMIKYINLYSCEKVNPNRSISRVVNADSLIFDIKSGFYDKEPCDVCNKAGRSFGDYGDCDIDGNVLRIDCSEVNYHSTATIEYCPMCGRKLEVES